MKRLITFSLLIALLTSPLHCLASGTSFSETSNAVNKKVHLQNLVTEYLSQEAKDTPRVVSEVIALWNNNGIKMTLPEKEYGARINEGRSHDEYILIKGNDHDSFEILYSIHYDASRDNLCIYIPHTYRHLRKAFATVISYYTGYDISDSYTIYDNLKKSIVNSKSQKIIDNLGIYLTVTSKREILEVERSASVRTTPTEIPSNAIQSTIDYFTNLFNEKKVKKSPAPSTEKSTNDLKKKTFDLTVTSFPISYKLYADILGEDCDIRREWINDNQAIIYLNDICFCTIETESRSDFSYITNMLFTACPESQKDYSVALKSMFLTVYTVDSYLGIDFTKDLIMTILPKSSRYTSEHCYYTYTEKANTFMLSITPR